MSTATSRAEQIATFYAHYAHRLARKVASQVTAPTGEVIDDACQHAWTKLLQRDDIALDERGANWLTTVAIRAAWRMASVEREVPAGVFRDTTIELLELDEPLSLEAGCDEQAIDRTVHSERVAALAKLTPLERRDLLLHAAGFSYQEIATATVTNYATVNRHLSSGRHKLHRVARARAARDRQHRVTTAPLCQARVRQLPLLDYRA